MIICQGGRGQSVKSIARVAEVRIRLLAQRQQMNNEVGGELPMRPPQARRQEVATEDRAERVQVGDVEEAQCAHQHVNVDRRDPCVEDAVASAAPQDALDRANDAGVNVADPTGFAQMASMMNVLDGDEPNELRVRMVVVEREFDQAAHRAFGGKIVEMQRGFGVTDLGVRPLEHGNV